VSVGGINVDAHLDMRPVVDGRLSSGTPYRRIIEELGVGGEHLVAFGLHPSVNSKAHYAWARNAGVECRSLGQVRAQGVVSEFVSALEGLERSSNALFVSMDLDVFAGPYAPGVSAPGTDGLVPAEGRAIAHAAGKNPKVRLFELMELNPLFDTNERTA